MLSKLLVFGKYIEYREMYRFRCWDEIWSAKKKKKKTANEKKKNTVTTPRSAHYLPSKVLLNKTEIREEMK